MRLVLKRVADSKWRVFGDRQSIGGGKLRSNVTTRIGSNLGMVVEPQEKVVLRAGYRTVASLGLSYPS